MPVVMDGLDLVKIMEENQKAQIEKLWEKGIKPCIAVIRAGEKPDSVSYEKSIIKKLEKIGIICKKCTYEESISKEGFLENVKNVNADKDVHGIIIMQPLPAHLQCEEVNYLVETTKDVDGINPASLGQIGFGRAQSNIPCTAEAVIKILEHYEIPTKGKKAVVLGRSTIVGKPAALLLLNKDATVTVCHSRTENLPQVCAEADILVAAVGRPKMVTADYIKEGAVVIDVGINVDENGKLCGDVNYEDCFDKSSYITPVPRGVGTVTTALLAEHVIKAAELLN